MKIEGTYKFKAAQEQVWEVLTHPRYLEKAIPGCEKLEETEPGKYDATLKIGIAAIKGMQNGFNKRKKKNLAETQEKNQQKNHQHRRAPQNDRLQERQTHLWPGD